MITKKLIEGLIDEHITGTDLFLVKFDVALGNKITVFIDSDTSLDISGCVALSRHIESSLDRDKEDFELSVSSAGLDHPFVSERQFKKYIGKNIDISMKDGKKITGQLLEYKTDSLVVRRELSKKKIKAGEATDLQLETKDIKETKGSISFK
jgi:ribosome maturation factor RimP